MQPSGIVADYLDALTHELRFDLDLARRVRGEVEDHLLEAIDDERGHDAGEAARRAIARFGDPREIARQYAPLSLLRQARRIGGTLIVAIAAILVLMKGRGAVYEQLQWRLNTDWPGISTILLAIDRYAFQAAMVVGVLGWIYIASRRVSPTPHSAYQRQLKRCLLLPLAAASLLTGAVTLDAILGGLRLFDARISLAALVPLLSLAIEIALVGVIARQFHNAIQRTTLVAALFADERDEHFS